MGRKTRAILMIDMMLN